MRFDGNKLKALREARRLDQTTLSHRARVYASGMNQSQISRYENSGQEPSMRNALALAKALDVPVAELYDGEDDAARERREAAADDEEDDLMGALTSTIDRLISRRVTEALQRERTFA